ncbi:MAG: hypothetical protein M1383_03765 [Patescibacteria group bacterium]|nr:hypothetical protein [Patescibacteria group bacterium]
MANLNDLINLAKADGGKFFVLDEKGDARLVIMGVEDYQRLLLGKLQRQVRQQAEDIENINREIIKAQLQEIPIQAQAAGQPDTMRIPGQPTNPEIPKPNVAPPQIIYSQTSSAPQKSGRIDLREEVIDPSFDFEGPKIEIDDL